MEAAGGGVNGGSEYGGTPPNPGTVTTGDGQMSSGLDWIGTVSLLMQPPVAAPAKPLLEVCIPWPSVVVRARPI